MNNSLHHLQSLVASKVGKKISGFNMRHWKKFEKEFEKPNAPFGQIVNDHYECRDTCIALAPKCGGFTYFSKEVKGKHERGQCLLKASPEQVNTMGPYKYISNPAAVSGSLSCLGIEEGKMYFM